MKRYVYVFIGIAILVAGFFVVYEFFFLPSSIPYGLAWYGPIDCVDNLCNIELGRSPYVPSTMHNTVIGELRGATLDQIGAFIKENLAKQGIVVRSVEFINVTAVSSNTTYNAGVKVSESDLNKLWKLGFYPGMA